MVDLEVGLAVVQGFRPTLLRAGIVGLKPDLQGKSRADVVDLEVGVAVVVEL